MFNLVGSILERFHRHEGGAVIMLVLAGTMIIFMTALVMYDAGQAAHDKIDVQIAADTAAYSQAAVKARSMNMIAYTNTSKRIFYGYSAVYFAAYQALILSVAAYAADCFKIFPNLHACYRFGVGTAQLVSETIELFATNLPSMLNRSRAEVRELNRYQAYMTTITPWWGYAENVTRSMRNGATLSASWPPPPGSLTSVPDVITRVLNFIDSFVGTSLMGYVPEHTYASDSLPVQRREQNALLGTLQAHTTYCASYFMSWEQILLTLTHIMESNSGIRGISKDGQTIVMLLAQSLNPLNCAIASAILGNDVLDYKLDGSLLNLFGSSSRTDDKWLQSTSNITIAYRAHAGRNSNSGDRGRLQIVNGSTHDYTRNPLYTNEGYWALARSEIVYTRSAVADTLGNLLGSRNPFSRAIQGVLDSPNMWSPRWTGRLRPLVLPGESLGSTTHGGKAGLNAVYHDALPYMVLASLAGLLSDDFSIDAALHDFAFFELATAGYGHSNLQGFEK